MFKKNRQLLVRAESAERGRGILVNPVLEDEFPVRFEEIFPVKLTNTQDQQVLVYDALIKKFVNQTLGSVTIIYGNLDGGDPASNYGGTISIDGGFYNSF